MLFNYVPHIIHSFLSYTFFLWTWRNNIPFSPCCFLVHRLLLLESQVFLFGFTDGDKHVGSHFSVCLSLLTPSAAGRKLWQLLFHLHWHNRNSLNSFCALKQTSRFLAKWDVVAHKSEKAGSLPDPLAAVASFVSANYTNLSNYLLMWKCSALPPLSRLSKLLFFLTRLNWLRTAVKHFTDVLNWLLPCSTSIFHIKTLHKSIILLLGAPIT